MKIIHNFKKNLCIGEMVKGCACLLTYPVKTAHYLEFKMCLMKWKGFLEFTFVGISSLNAGYDEIDCISENRAYIASTGCAHSFRDISGMWLA